MSITRMCVRLVSLLLVAGSVAACDKCGERVKFNAPSVSNACGDNSARS